MLTPLKLHRLSKGMKLCELARKTGISISLLSKIETGVTRGSEEAREKISKELGISKRVLFGGN